MRVLCRFGLGVVLLVSGALSGISLLESQAVADCTSGPYGCSTGTAGINCEDNGCEARGGTGNNDPRTCTGAGGCTDLNNDVTCSCTDDPWTNTDCDCTGSFK